jgi:hypothetical protein
MRKWLQGLSVGGIVLGIYLYLTYTPPIEESSSHSAAPNLDLDFSKEIGVAFVIVSTITLLCATFIRRRKTVTA